MKSCPECATKGCCDVAGIVEMTRSVGIVGIMNVGKTTLFNRLCGTRAATQNLPGSTRGIRIGKLKGSGLTVLDTPGIYSLFSMNEDERASRDVLLPSCHPTEVQSIVLMLDAKNMSRSLAVALMYFEYGLPVLLDINMIDEAAPRGIEIKYSRLESLLGVPVAQTIARDGIGVPQLVNALGTMRRPDPQVVLPDYVEEYIEAVKKLTVSPAIPPRLLGILLMAADSGAEEYVGREYGEDILVQLRDLAAESLPGTSATFNTYLCNLFQRRADKIVEEAVRTEESRDPLLLEKLSNWCTDLSTGVPIAFGVIALMYLFVGSFGATFLVDLINVRIFEGILIPWVTDLMRVVPNEFVRGLFIDPDFGILPTGIFLALGLVMPVIFCFYLAFGVLDDSGYLPRLSILLDKILQLMGLNGKGVIPLVMGFSCVTMAVLTTRMLNSEREKNIASFLLFLAMPCAPLVAVMLIILEKMPISATITVFGIIGSQILVAGYLAAKILPGSSSHLFMEIPPMRLPKAGQVVRMAALKTVFFMKEAVPVFVMASMAVFLFQWFGGLEALENLTRPLFRDIVGLPDKSIQVFIKTIIRRESGAAELEHISHLYTNLQLVVSLLIMTFIAPCLNAIFVLIKERGTLVAVSIVGTVTIYAIVLGTIVNYACTYLGITFS